MANFDIKLPKLGESITDGTIASLYVAVGDKVSEDQILFEVSTAKVTSEVPSPVDGIVSEIKVKEGDTVDVGDIVMVLTIGSTSESTSKESDDPKKSAPLAQENTQISKKEDKPKSERWYSPIVLQKAKLSKIDQQELDRIKGTGYNGRLSKRDIEKYIEKTKNNAPSPLKRAAVYPFIPPHPRINTGDVVVPMNGIRKLISDSMLMSKHVSAHVTSVIEIDVTNLVNLRNKNKDSFKQQNGIPLTFTPFVVESVVNALKKYPIINSSVDGSNIIMRKRINVGIAVTIENNNLIVPVIKDVDTLGLTEVATQIEGLANKARNNKLSPEDISGGTFTVSNLGSFKGLFGTPIINQPEVAILGVGYIEKKPSVISTQDGDTIAIRSKMYLSLTFDHRIIDGTLGGNFLREIGDYLENYDMKS